MAFIWATAARTHDAADVLRWTRPDDSPVLKPDEVGLQEEEEVVRNLLDGSTTTSPADLLLLRSLHLL
jgi:hypothetical protein